MGYVIGCDVGSQGAKGVLLRADGVTMGVAGSRYGITNPASGWAEQDPSAYTSALTSVVRELLTASDVDPADVTHLGVASQVDGVVATDPSGRPVRDAIIWMDRRAVDETAVMGARISATRLFDLSGSNLDASHSAPKMMWIRDHEPQVFAAASQLGSVGSYVALWLTGVSVHDHANASSTLLYGLTTRDYDDELLAAADLDRALLPSIAASHEVIGTLTREAAEVLGLSPRCVVVTGTGDEHGAALGAGGLDARTLIDVVGTAEVVASASDAPVIDTARLVETHAHAVDGSYLIENPGFVSGGSILWLAESVLGVQQADVFPLAEQSDPGANGVRFLPALMGSMAPRWNGDMRGAFAGLSSSHTRADLARAVIEGCCFAFRDVADRMRELGLGGTALVVGGGARSDLWLATKASISGMSLRRVLSPEATARGAAILAALAAGDFADATTAVAACVELDTATIDPDPTLVERYDQAYREYRALFDAVESALAPPREDPA